MYLQGCLDSRLADLIIHNKYQTPQETLEQVLLFLGGKEDDDCAKV